MKNFLSSRRSFLAGSAAAGLGAALPGKAISSLNKVVATTSYQNRAADQLTLSNRSEISLSSWIGGRVDACVSRRVMAQNVDLLVTPFLNHADTDNGWRGEFWGKWFTSAVLAYRYQPTKAHRAVLDQAVKSLLATQSPDGDISTYDAQHRGGDWDVWSRKYVLLGLIAYYDLTLSRETLAAAVRVGDTLLRDFGRGKQNLQDASLNLVAGLSSCSVLEPVCLLYQRTGERRFLEFATYIVASWEQPSKVAPAGMRLVEDALKGTPPSRMVAPKAYEMMSCFEGICEYYRITGDIKYLHAVVDFAQTIRKTERMVNGSASNQELWCRGAITQTAVLEQPQETCVTTTWIKLCTQILRLTGDSVWADEIELSLYNALASAQTPDGSWWSYFSPLIGQRVPSLSQYKDIHLSCCVANGPRSLLLMPAIAVMESTDGLAVNLYLPGTFQISSASGAKVKLTQTTDYPRGNHISLAVESDVQVPHTLRLRIPAWSKQTLLTINGTTVPCIPGTYAKIRRIWNADDRIELSFDLRGRAVQSPANEDYLAVMRGPILLALDNRLVTARELDVWLAADKEGYVDLKDAPAEDPDVWMSFDVPFEVKPYHFFQHHIETLRMCDYASAGNAWSAENLYRTWLPQPLYMKDLYASDTWRLMYPDEKQRPVIS